MPAPKIRAIITSRMNPKIRDIKVIPLMVARVLSRFMDEYGNLNSPAGLRSRKKSHHAPISLLDTAVIGIISWNFSCNMAKISVTLKNFSSSQLRNFYGQ
jgi:hypothetical protein